MKAILISDHAKWCALMMNGKKTIEVRKGTALYKAIQKLIDENGYADIYVYCTKGKAYLGKKEIGRNFYNEPIYIYDLDYGETFKGRGNKKFYSSVGVYSINGKVIFKFRCYMVEEIKPKVKLGLLNSYDTYETETLVINPLLEKCCLDYNELDFYLKWKKGTAIHISDLEIFDKPKELRELRTKTDLGFGGYKIMPLLKAPQSWCYIEVGE